MKKLVLMSLVLALAGCSNFQGLNAVNDTVQGKMQSCLMTQAQSRLQAGTLFTNSVSATAKELVGIYSPRRL